MQKMLLCKDQQQSKLCYTNVYFTDIQRGTTIGCTSEKGLLIYKATKSHIELDTKLQY